MKSLQRIEKKIDKLVIDNKYYLRMTFSLAILLPIFMLVLGLVWGKMELTFIEFILSVIGGVLLGGLFWVWLTLKLMKKPL